MKVGDIVKVYGNVERPKDDGLYATNHTAYLRGSKGVVADVLADDALAVTILIDKKKVYNKTYEVIVHPKQCRRIKAKK